MEAESILTQLRNAIVQNMRTDTDGVKCLYEGGELDDLLPSLVKIVESASEKTWEAAMKRAIHILEPTQLIAPDKETFMKELF